MTRRLGTRNGLALVAAATLALAACGGDSEDTAGAGASGGTAPTTVDMVLYGHNVYNWCYYAADDQGFFTDEDVAVSEPLMVNTDADANRAMISGEGDVALATVGFLQAVDPDATPRVQFIAGTGAAAYSFVGGNDVTELADLAGATIALSPEGQPSADVAVNALNEALGEGNWTPLHIGGGSGARIAALEAGQAQGAFMAAPLDAVIEQQGDFHIIEYLQGEDASFQIGAVLASTEFLEDQPEAAERWTRAYVRGCEWLYDPSNEERAVALLAEKVEVDVPAIQQTYDAYIAGDLSGLTPPRDGALVPENLLRVAELLERQGSLEGPVEPLVDALVNEDVYEAATAGS